MQDVILMGEWANTEWRKLTFPTPLEVHTMSQSLGTKRSILFALTKVGK